MNQEKDPVVEHSEDVTELTPPPRYRNIAYLMGEDLKVLVRKNEQYGESWKRRGGRGAWYTLVRPWDRLEQMVEAHKGDVFAAGEQENEDADSDILDSLRDIRTYLYLIEDEIVRNRSLRALKASHEGKKILDDSYHVELRDPYAKENVDEGR